MNHQDEEAASAANRTSLDAQRPELEHMEVERLVGALGLFRPGALLPWRVVQGLLVMAVREKLVVLDDDRPMLTEFLDAMYFLTDWIKDAGDRAEGAAQ